MKHLTTLLILLSLCGRGAAEDKAVLMRETLGVDADRTLGCKRGVDPTFDSGNNVTRLEAALASTTRRYSPFIPGGDWELTETLTIDNTWGPSLFGAGGITAGLGDTHYDPFGGSRYGSPLATRLIWNGAADGTMVEMLSGGSVLSGITFQGCRVAGAGPEPTGGTYPNRAKVGFHIRPSNDGGAGMTGAKCLLEHLHFYQCETAILVGRNLEGVGGPSYTGSADLHADTITATDLHFTHPFDGAKAGLGSCIHIRNNQSVNNVIQAIHSHGDPQQIFYLERGGKTWIGAITSSGDTTAVRTGIIDVNGGGLVVGKVSLDGNTNAKLLKGDVHATSSATPYVEIQSADIPEGCNAIPQVDVGPGTWVIRNCNYLKAGSIKMTGLSTEVEGGTKRQVCHVMLDNATTYGCSIEDLVDVASSGPYLLTWRNCHCSREGPPPPAETQDYGLPFEDSNAETRIDHEMEFLDHDEP